MIYRQTIAGVRILLLWVLWPMLWMAGIWLIHQFAALPPPPGYQTPDWYEALCNVLWLVGMIFLALNLRARRGWQKRT
jgi:hypothetical protein